MTALDTILDTSTHVPDPFDDEPMVEESPGIWTWREKRRLSDGSVVTITRCHVSAVADPAHDPFPRRIPRNAIQKK